jgi:thioredoxin reductase (NADPH)
MQKKEYDLIIIGGGAAGLTAAIYAARRTLKTLVLAKDIGGQANLASSIENYPGRYPVGGFELLSEMKKQAEEFGAQVQLTEVMEITKEAQEFGVKTPQGSFKAKAIILAFGLTPQDLGVPGEQEFKNKGVSYCANCDGPLFKDKTVVVVGGGNSALDATEYLSKIASEVYLVHRNDTFRGEKVLVDRVKETETVKILLHTKIKEIKGDETVSNVLIRNNQTSEEKDLKCDGVFLIKTLLTVSSPLISFIFV